MSLKTVFIIHSRDVSIHWREDSSYIIKFRSWYGMAEQNIEEREKMLP